MSIWYDIRPRGDHVLVVSSDLYPGLLCEENTVLHKLLERGRFRHHRRRIVRTITIQTVSRVRSARETMACMYDKATLVRHFNTKIVTDLHYWCHSEADHSWNTLRIHVHVEHLP